MRSLSYQAFATLDALRTKLGLSIAEISSLLGIGRTTYHRLIRNSISGESVLSFELDCAVQIVLAVLSEFCRRGQLAQLQVSDPAPNSKIRVRHLKLLHTGVKKFKPDHDTGLQCLATLADCLGTAEHFKAARQPAKKRKVK